MVGTFIKYCSKHEIRYKKIVPHTPQYNGVAKSMNTTLNKRVRSLEHNLLFGEQISLICVGR